MTILNCRHAHALSGNRVNGPQLLSHAGAGRRRSTRKDANKMWTKALALTLTSVAMLSDLNYVQAGARRPRSPERCITYDQHQDGLDTAIRMFGRSAVVTHGGHPPICTDRPSSPTDSTRR